MQFGTPAGFTPSPANVGNDATDSDAVGGVTGNYTLASGETNLTVDAGFFATRAAVRARHLRASPATRSTSGTAGNIRTFSVNGVSVKASGVQPPGQHRRLGDRLPRRVLRAASASPTPAKARRQQHAQGRQHRRRDNYVLFEFSQPVIVDQAFLD